MRRLVVLVTSPRLPAGLLTGPAWRALLEAPLIATSDVGSPLARALIADGLRVEAMPHASAADLRRLAADHDLVWLAADDGDDEVIQALATDNADRAQGGAAGDGVGVEVLVGSADPVGAGLLDLVRVMDRLRLECPWDREQTHESLVRHLIEETYETVEAIESGDCGHLREELGDLLLQVVFHARIASEHDSEAFGIDDVAAGVVDKLIRRHPHVFAVSPDPDASASSGSATGPHDVTSADGVQSAWDDIKAAEKSRTSAMDGIAPGQPALSLAATVIGRTRSSAAPPRPTDPDREVLTASSLGEALFTLVAVACATGLDPEQALRSRVRQEMAEVRVQEQRAMQAASGRRG